MNEADVLLRMKHGMVRLDSVWGVAGGRRPVKHLVKKVSYRTCGLIVRSQVTRKWTWTIWEIIKFLTKWIGDHIFIIIGKNNDHICITFALQMILLLKEYLSSEDIEEVSPLLCKLSVYYLFFLKFNSRIFYCIKT